LEKDSSKKQPTKEITTSTVTVIPSVTLEDVIIETGSTQQTLLAMRNGLARRSFRNNLTSKEKLTAKEKRMKAYRECQSANHKSVKINHPPDVILTANEKRNKAYAER